MHRNKLKLKHLRNYQNPLLNCEDITQPIISFAISLFIYMFSNKLVHAAIILIIDGSKFIFKFFPVYVK